MDNKDSSKKTIPGLELLGLSFNSRSGQYGKRVIKSATSSNEEGTPAATNTLITNNLFSRTQSKKSSSNLIDSLTTLSVAYLNDPQYAWHYNKNKRTAWIISPDKQKLEELKLYLETLSKDLNVEVRTTSDTKLPILLINDYDLEKFERLSLAPKSTNISTI
jgi:hypothetical protein